MTTDSATTFLLIRHGLTDSVGRAMMGRSPGIHLNAVGQEQARRLADRLRDVSVTAIVSSPLERTRETSAPIADSHTYRSASSKSSRNTKWAAGRDSPWASSKPIRCGGGSIRYGA